METIVPVAGMLLINLLGWAFMGGVLWQKVGGVAKNQERHEGLSVSRAHPPNGPRGRE